MFFKNFSVPSTRPKILGVGTSAVDVICIAPEETRGSRTRISKVTVEGGGLTGNSLVAAARLGAQAIIVGRMGDDEFGNIIVSGLQKEGMNTSNMVKAPDMVSPFAFIRVDPETGERSINNYRGVYPQDLPVPEPYGLLKGVDCVVMDNVWAEASVKFARAARNLGIPVVGDLLPDEKNNEELSRLVDYLIVDQKFAEKMGFSEDYSRALEPLHRLGAKVTAVTVGKDGCWYSDGSSPKHQPAFKIDAVDTTGAGDTFHGAAAFGVACGWDIDNIILFASACSALKCTRFGGRRGIPYFPEVIEFIQNYSED